MQVYSSSDTFGTKTNEIEKTRNELNNNRRKLAQDVDKLEISLLPVIPTSKKIALAAERFIRIVAEIVPLFHYPGKLAVYGLRTLFGTTIPKENSAPDGANTPATPDLAAPKGTPSFFQSARFFTDICDKKNANTKKDCNKAEKANPDLNGDLGFLHKITNWW